MMGHHHTCWALLLCWIVMAQPGHVVDGDTFDATMQIWPNLDAFERVRILGVNTPELHGESKEAALKAKAFTEAWLSKGWITLTVCKRDAFGRLLAEVRRGDENLSSLLLEGGLGVPFERK